MLTVPIRRLRPDAILPSCGSARAAGYDLYACLEEESLIIPPHSSVKVPTGLAAAIPEGYFGAVYARSGLACKQGLRPANCVGVVDSDYRGEIMVFLHNDNDEARSIQKGDRIAQLVIQPYLSIAFAEVESLEDTDRGEGGFGSTGR